MDIEDFRKRLVTIFDDVGYLNLTGMLDEESSREIRNYIAAQFAENADTKPYDLLNRGNLGSIKLDVFSRYKMIYQRIFFNTALVFHLKLLLGENFCIIPETGIHKNSFGAWHKDVGSHQRAGLTFHWEEGFRIVTIGFYFQENTVEYGGGLEVIPASHKIRFPSYSPDFKGTLVRSKPGDTLVFDHNLDHKASWPTAEIDEEHTKYSLFLCASANTHHAYQYMDFVRGRGEYTFLRDYSYPDDLVRHASSQGYVLLK